MNLPVNLLLGIPVNFWEYTFTFVELYLYFVGVHMYYVWVYLYFVGVYSRLLIHSQSRKTTTASKLFI